jgi:hypothetical protein
METFFPRPSEVDPRDQLQHEYESAEPSPSGKMGFRCKLCGHYTNAPSKGRFSPCPKKVLPT